MSPHYLPELETACPSAAGRVGLGRPSGTWSEPPGHGRDFPAGPRRQGPGIQQGADPQQAFRYDVAVLGLGYVGLPTALALHGGGAAVLGIDINAGRLASVSEGAVDLPPQDKARLVDALRSERFRLSDDPARLGSARAVVVCVPTPVDEHLLPELEILRAACAAVVDHAAAGHVIILTSTTYVGSTMDLLVRPLERRGFTVGSDIFVVFSPERIDPGNTGYVQQAVPRVLGGTTPACTEAAAQVLAATASGLRRVSSPETAEMTKLLENTFRAVNIALVNEFADACRALDLDVMEVISGAATKPYGFMPFYPGPGVGGHCIPCDPHYLLWQLRRQRLATPVIESAMAGIAARPEAVVRRAREVLDAAGLPLRGARVLVLGVTYKPNVEDVRESPALVILQRLRVAGAQVAYHDPLIPRLGLPGGEAMVSIDEPSRDAFDLILVHTRHSGVDLTWLRDHPCVLDTTYRLAELSHRAVL